MRLQAAKKVSTCSLVFFYLVCINLRFEFSIPSEFYIYKRSRPLTKQTAQGTIILSGQILLVPPFASNTGMAEESTMRVILPLDLGKPAEMRAVEIVHPEGVISISLLDNMLAVDLFLMRVHKPRSCSFLIPE